MNYASRAGRLFGQFIDGVVAAVPLFIALIVMSASEATGVVMLVVGAVASILYYFLADGLNDGRSVAKVMLGMQVIHSQSAARRSRTNRLDIHLRRKASDSRNFAIRPIASRKSSSFGKNTILK